MTGPDAPSPGGFWDTGGGLTLPGGGEHVVFDTMIIDYLTDALAELYD